ncbi:tRNA threonylcarbamoyladenosine dehydratase [Clostridium butyricum]|jgi:tRNA A37 threonylcarbamoyladenosine dehydratase|uniref:tRNA threonylcarbamoyladenosine dehydratase n=1 Tax=Clostridium butyricum TaxID=1492 RepID=UPI0003D5EA7A|nr:tRNA threonylcarbamoyladenosine dehydratase [Clostridium butyricum]APF23332.1 thiF family protein [Clostridium butyricum]ETI91960.1 MAG: Dinucleotide-utilizing enzyme involved in molybdopterin and thiamine biosynthesis family 1 [Clostridium butyricum DORA_1]MDU1508515.1 tRNA threonylcarbamoyladenosine dehydratase [Clostridium butyricum]MDU4800370.1 tRNA threonylcarbamoyladenosine dehydratase [Clostridium butyricum]
MAEHSLTRTELLIGNDGLNKLRKSKVIVFGVGGVGGFAVEALARAGVGEITVVDNDTVSLTNLNRQIIATYDTIDKAKVEVIKERIQSINKDCKVITRQVFVSNDNIEEIVPKDIDYVVDAIDTVSAKLGLAEYCYKNNINIMSSMGTGNKLDPTQFKVSDVFKTQVCPLAKVMRCELRKRGVEKLKVVYSEEMPLKPKSEYSSEVKGTAKRPVPGSMSFVPPVAGMIIAGEVIKDILGINNKK